LDGVACCAADRASQVARARLVRRLFWATSALPQTSACRLLRASRKCASVMLVQGHPSAPSSCGVGRRSVSQKQRPGRIARHRWMSHHGWAGFAFLAQVVQDPTPRQWTRYLAIGRGSSSFSSRRSQELSHDAPW
jgi:hypothetical protein